MAKANMSRSESLNVLAALSDLPSDDPYIWTEFQAIKDAVLENQKAGGLKDLVSRSASINVSKLTVV